MATKTTKTEQAIIDREARTREANKERTIAARPVSKAAEANKAKKKS